MMTGVWMPSSRNARHTSKPLRRGSITSRMIEIEAGLPRADESLVAVAGRLDFVPFARQTVAQGQHESRFVLDEQDPPRGGTAGRPGHPAGSSRCAGAASAGTTHAGGRWIENVLPRPGVLFSVTVPPCVSMIRFTRLSPRPLP